MVLYDKRIKRRLNCFIIDECQCNVKRLRRKADIKKALEYVEKEDKNTLEIGDKPAEYQKLTKREKIFYVLQHDNRECLDSGHFNFSEIAKFELIRNMWYCEWPSFKKRQVTWLAGETGAGKTRTAWASLLMEYDIKDIWTSCGDLTVYFNGYRGQRGVILDDLRPKTIKFETLLRILDGYPCEVNVKFGCCLWRAERIFITAPCTPNEMYINHETGETWDHLDQLLRRIDVIQVMEKNGDEYIIPN